MLINRNIMSVIGIQKTGEFIFTLFKTVSSDADFFVPVAVAVQYSHQPHSVTSSIFATCPSAVRKSGSSAWTAAAC